MELKSGGIAMIKNIITDLPDSEKKIAEYILDNPRQFVSMTVSELGQKSHTSSSAVVRLCKSLGLKGYQDLKIRIFRDIETDDDTSYIDIKKNDTVQSLTQSIRNNAVKSINETMDFIDYKIVEKCVDMMLQANTMIFLGMGASFISAKDAQQKFLRINKSCYAFEDIHLTATMISNLKQEDLVVGISSSGETKETVKLMKLANSKGVKTIGITKYGKSSLSKITKMNLYTPSDIETPFRSAATSSRMAQLYIIDVLFMSFATSNFDSTIEYLGDTADAISIFK